MLSRTQALRWSGQSISNGRRRLVGGREVCSFIATSGAPTHHGHSFLLTQHDDRVPSYHLNTRDAPPVTLTTQQVRSLSLFGWGSSSNPSPEPTASASSPQNLQVSEPSAFPSAFESTRAVKASYATSDAPDPSILQSVPTRDHEPALLKSFEEAIATPHGPLSTTDPITENFASIAERSGYLKEVCGIDFGWGTTSLFQWIVEDFHMYTGLSWTLSFVVVGAVLRVLLFRTAVRAQEMQVKMREVEPILGPLRQEYKDAVANGDKIKIQTLGHQMRAVSRDSGLSVLAAFMPMLFQIPLSFAGFRLGHAMAALPVPALENETFLWLSNLALSDPYIIPLFCAGLGFLTIRLQSIATPANNPQSKTMMNFLMFVIPPTSFVFLHWQPGIVQVFFAIQTIFIAFQARIFNISLTRKWLGLPPLPSNTTTRTQPTSLSNQPSQSTNIAGMVIRPSPTSTKSLNQTTPPTPPPAEQQISIIDKAVNALKSKTSAISSSISNVTKQVQSSDRGAKKVKAQESKRKETYEYKRRQDAQMEREWRNQNVRDQSKGKGDEKGKSQ